jgi:hypothetical protein
MSFNHRLWAAPLFTVTSIAALSISVACSSKTGPAITALPPQAQPETKSFPKPPTQDEFSRWRSTIRALAKPNGSCFFATYPERQWHVSPCVAAPIQPYAPTRGVRPTMVGNGDDWSDAVAGHQYFAQGSFHHVTGVKSENQQGQPNDYSLQLNTQPFNSYECKKLGSPDPGNCREWQQFVYASDGSSAVIFIQYWLINFGSAGTNCPSGWNSSGTSEVSCFINSSGGSVPVEPATNLGNLILDGNAGKGSKHDFIEFSVYNTNKTYFVNGDNHFPDLSSNWKNSEFNVFGNCCYNEAIFNSGSTAVVRLEAGSGSNKVPPTCEQEGFTGETNNLSLTTEGPNWPRVTYPSIVFTETNAKHSQPLCLTRGPQP